MFGATLSDRYELSTSLRVQGSRGLDFDEVSRILRSLPSQVIRKGSAAKTGRVYETDTWLLASEVTEQGSLENHLHWFVKRYLKEDVLKDLRSVTGVEDIDLFCAFSVPSEGCRIYLPADLLLSLKRMELDLELSVVFADQEVEADAVAISPDNACDAVQRELKERSSAVLRGAVMPALQPAILNTASLYPDGGASGSAIASSNLDIRLELALQTQISEGTSLDSKLQELGEELRSSAELISKWVQVSSLIVEGRFETNSEWASASLSHRSFNLPVVFHCPMMIEVAFSSE